jgi:hypothetical protein
MATTFSLDDIPEIMYSTPDLSLLMKANVAALEMDSQKMTLPVLAITTTKPGSVDEAEGETRHPTGRASLGFEEDGRVKVKVSGDCEVEL